MLKKWTILLLAAMLCIFAKVEAEEITIEEVRTQMGENTVVYPQLEWRTKPFSGRSMTIS